MTYAFATDCGDSGIGSDDRVVFVWYQFLVMFLLPTLTMLFCYARVIWVLWMSTKELAKMTASDR